MEAKAGRMTMSSERSWRIRRHVVSRRRGLRVDRMEVMEGGLDWVAWGDGVEVVVGGEGGEVDEEELLAISRRICAASRWMVKWSASMIWVNV